MSGRSSLIGVAISLSGNVLISLALNCQKLAHIRLQQEQEQQRGQVQKRGGQSSHGRQDQGVSSSGDGGNAGHASGERSALLGPTQSRKDGDGYGTLDGEGGADSPSSTSSGTKHDQRRQSASEQQQQQQGGNGPQENAEGDAQFDSSTSPSTFSTDFLKSRLWWLGIGLMTLGEFGNFLCELGGRCSRSHASTTRLISALFPAPYTQHMASRPHRSSHRWGPLPSSPMSFSLQSCSRSASSPQTLGASSLPSSALSRSSSAPNKATQCSVPMSSGRQSAAPSSLCMPPSPLALSGSLRGAHRQDWVIGTFYSTWACALFLVRWANVHTLQPVRQRSS